MGLELRGAAAQGLGLVMVVQVTSVGLVGVRVRGAAGVAVVMVLQVPAAVPTGLHKWGSSGAMATTGRAARTQPSMTYSGLYECGIRCRRRSLRRAQSCRASGVQRGFLEPSTQTRRAGGG